MNNIKKQSAKFKAYEIQHHLEKSLNFIVGGDWKLKDFRKMLPLSNMQFYYIYEFIGNSVRIASDNYYLKVFCYAKKKQEIEDNNIEGIGLIDSQYGNRLISFAAALWKVNGQSDPDKIASSDKVDTPYEVSKLVKAAIDKDFFGDSDDDVTENNPDPTIPNKAPELINASKNWYKLMKLANNKQLIIMRAPSGAGKSSLAKILGMGGVIYSTDDFFEVDGKYNFDGSKLGQAHKWNFERAIEAMKKGISPIVIDNTNVKFYEAKAYVKAGIELGYSISFEEPNWSKDLKDKDGKWNPDFINKLQIDRNTRNKTKLIREQKVKEMIDRYDYDATIEKVLNSKAPWE
jgi:hypothetical protein